MDDELNGNSTAYLIFLELTQGPCLEILRMQSPVFKSNWCRCNILIILLSSFTLSVCNELTIPKVWVVEKTHGYTIFLTHSLTQEPSRIKMWTLHTITYLLLRFNFLISRMAMWYGIKTSITKWSRVWSCHPPFFMLNFILGRWACALSKGRWECGMFHVSGLNGSCEGGVLQI